VRAFPFEGQHRIDHMFDDPGAGDLAILGHMANQDDGRAGLLGKPDERLGRSTHLRHGAGSGLNRVGPHRLDRIDDNQAGSLAFRKGCDDVFNRGFSREFDRTVAQA
jgi:hypothetical protein